ncbi:hypothetical protein [Vibrio quintilis]|uniref:Uncharacterized protein n=1 Tax=Vibrio quintilis TaxID=1117707 RepID=A0A1M7YR50_9VIBR|nr:hypothetical protein [Vibrio quintilis]SHO55016.1 hypothetical protein VQ7734_00735 [Vibrio quintilis]
MTDKQRLSAAESHELACRVSALGAKQVLDILRQLQGLTLARNARKPEKVPQTH